jgi:hypothetical protein
MQATDTAPSSPRLHLEIALLDPDAHPEREYVVRKRLTAEESIVDYRLSATAWTSYELTIGGELVRLTFRPDVPQPKPLQPTYLRSGLS